MVSLGSGKFEKAVEGFADGFRRKGIKEQLRIERDNDSCRGPTEDLDPKGVDKLVHLGFLSGEPHERPDCETKLHAQHNLAGHQ